MKLALLNLNIITGINAIQFFNFQFGKKRNVGETGKIRDVSCTKNLHNTSTLKNEFIMKQLSPCYGNRFNFSRNYNTRTGGKWSGNNKQVV